MAGQKREMFVGGKCETEGERRKKCWKKENTNQAAQYLALICDSVRRERMNDRDDRQWRRGRNN